MVHSKIPNVRPIFTSINIKDLEKELVAALYEQRSYERQILQYSPESSAPHDLRDAFFAARVRVNQIEKKIRLLRHSF